MIGLDLSRGKLQDCMKPAGPAVIPAKFVPNSDNLKMTLHVNGRQMMDGSTSKILYKCDEILKVISEHITLEPGDIVLGQRQSQQCALLEGRRRD
jgi:2-keto-4-pentenoate hydratase/2-oxohepta-3-ene-1,7-dioic acid hydratase in catechol pathway